jgi:transposase InsO family protein
MDFVGPFLNKNILIAVDAHSKWAEIVEMPQITTTKTITTLRHMFATHGISEQLVLDNGPQFTSSELVEFVKANGSQVYRRNGAQLQN